jgi:DNA-binding MarR family transcriptional regulator
MTEPERYSAALDRVLALVVLLNDDMTRSLARDGLTVSRAHVLWELRRRGPLTQRALADALAVSARNVTGLVDGLAASGLVTREAHPSDRRATLVTPTASGTALVEAMERDQETFGRLLFADLPAERLAAFVDTLDEVLGKLHAAGVTRMPEEVD